MERKLKRSCKIKVIFLSFSVGVFVSYLVGELFEFVSLWVSKLLSLQVFELVSWWVDRLMS